MKFSSRFLLVLLAAIVLVAFSVFSVTALPDSDTVRDQGPAPISDVAMVLGEAMLPIVVALETASSYSSENGNQTTDQSYMEGETKRSHGNSVKSPVLLE